MPPTRSDILIAALRAASTNPTSNDKAKNQSPPKAVAPDTMASRANKATMSKLRAGEDVTAKVLKKHEMILKQMFPGGIEASRKEQDYTRVFRKSQSHSETPRGAHYHHHQQPEGGTGLQDKGKPAVVDEDYLDEQRADADQDYVDEEFIDNAKIDRRGRPPKSKAHKWTDEEDLRVTTLTSSCRDISLEDEEVIAQAFGVSVDEIHRRIQELHEKHRADNEKKGFPFPREQNNKKGEMDGGESSKKGKGKGKVVTWEDQED